MIKTFNLHESLKTVLPTLQTNKHLKYAGVASANVNCKSPQKNSCEQLGRFKRVSVRQAKVIPLFSGDYQVLGQGRLKCLHISTMLLFEG